MAHAFLEKGLLLISTLLLGVLPAAPAGARLPKERATVARVPLHRAGQGTSFATLYEGQPVDVLKTVGANAEVQTRGPIRIRGWVPTHQLGICAREQAPARLEAAGDPVGYVPAGWCFRILEERGDDVRLADPTFGVNVLVDTRFLAADPDPARRFDPILAGFVEYRIQPQPMRITPTAVPWYTVTQGEWPMRSTHEEGDHAFIEIRGRTLVLQGWERTTRLYRDLFRNRDEVTLARRRLAEQKRPEPDPRPWFRLTRPARLFLQPGKDEVGDVDAGVLCTVNRRSGPWRQLRLEPKYQGKPHRALDTALWVHGEVLAEVRSAFDR